MRSVASDGDKYGGLNTPYKRDYQLLPDGFTLQAPWRAQPAHQKDGGPASYSSVEGTDRKKSNAQIVYTRVTPLDTHLVAGKAEGCVFVSRTQMQYTDTRLQTRVGSGPEKRSLVASLATVNTMLAKPNEPRVRLPAAYNPLDDWRRVPELREWPLDGVLLGLDNEANASSVLSVVWRGRALCVTSSRRRSCSRWAGATSCSSWPSCTTRASRARTSALPVRAVHLAHAGRAARAA